MRISPSVPVLIARGFQAIFSATVFIITMLLITGNKFGPLPLILGFSAGVSLATLIAALSTSIFRTSLHPWIRNTIDGGILSLNMAVGTVSLHPFNATTLHHRRLETTLLTPWL
jgi:hypothetical protein